MPDAQSRQGESVEKLRPMSRRRGPSCYGPGCARCEYGDCLGLGTCPSCGLPTLLMVPYGSCEDCEAMHDA